MNNGDRMWRAMGDFWEFLTYVKIIETPTLESPGGIIDFKIWPHTRELASIFLTTRQVVVLKAKQIGVSYLIAAYILWYALSHDGANILLFSRLEGDAITLLSKSKEMYRALPTFLRLRPGADSLTQLSFPSRKSNIKALASTESAGVGEHASIVVCDEWAFHPYAEANFNTVKPTIDTGGGQFIGVSTPDPTHPDSFMEAVYKEARLGNNNFVPLFYGYEVRPGRDEKWYKNAMKDIPPETLRGLTPELFMFKNYPRTEQEALSRPKSIAVFDVDVLNQMMGDVKNPVKVENIDNNIIHIYKPFHLGEYYIAATDTSHGIGKDYSVTCIMNVRTAEVVADIMNRHLSPGELASQSVDMLKLYKNPKWYIESNDYGGVTIQVALDLGYKNLGYQDDRKFKIGFDTKATRQGTGTRNELWGALVPAVNNHQITIYNKDGISQFYDVIRNVDKEGKIEAPGNRHDDYPMTVGICWLKKEEVQTKVWNSEPVKSLTFRR